MKSCVYDNIKKIQPTNPCRLVGCAIFFALIRQPMLRCAVHIFLLNRHRSYVPHIDFMPDCGTSRTGIIRTSYGAHLFDHLAADGARLAGGEVAVIALLEVDAKLARDFIFHVVQRALGLRHVDAVAAARVVRHSLFHLQSVQPYCGAR